MKGYYSDCDDFVEDSVVNNPVGYGIDEETPLDKNGSIKMITGEEKLVQSMKDIISTPVGTRFMNPSYGSKVYQALMEPNDYIAQDLTEFMVQDAITNNEPRVVVVGVTARVSTENKKVMNMQIYYKEKDSNDVKSFVYSANRQFPEME